MKVAIIHPFQFRYARGIERYTVSLAERLLGCGSEVHLLTHRWPDAVEWGGLPVNMQVHQVPYLRYHWRLYAIPFYVYWLARIQPDLCIIYFAGYGEAETLALSRLLHGQHYMIVFHYPVEQVPHRYQEFQRLGLAAHADSLVAVSSYVAEGAKEYFGRQCHVIANGVDSNVFRPSLRTRERIRESLGVGDEVPVIITAAALEERKGIQWIIRALPYLLTRFPSIQYWVLGIGPHLKALQDEVCDLKLQENVRFLGSVSNVQEYMAAADIGALLSYGEAYPIVPLEYMATSLPVLASTHPPFEEVLQSQWSIMVDEQNPQAVAQAIEQLVRDPERRRQMGTAGRAEVLRNRSWERVAEQYLSLMSKVVEQKPA